MSELRPAVPPVVKPQLRPVQHPDMSPVITHFCDRARPQIIPENLRALNASQRLAAIFWEARLRAFVTYSGGDPATCLTEATVQGLEFLIGQRGYAPWGLVFDRQSAYDVGGGPVWYARAGEYYELRSLGPRVQSWSVKLEAGTSDWLEEREWRIPVSTVADEEPAIPLASLGLVAVLVGDAFWSPIRNAQYHDVASGGYAIGPALPSNLAAVPRWWWNPATSALVQLPALL